MTVQSWFGQSAAFFTELKCRGGESVLPLLYNTVTPPHFVTARRMAHRFFHAISVNEGWSPTPVSRLVAERAHQHVMGPVPAEEG
jgi:hypothetical protein